MDFTANSSCVELFRNVGYTLAVAPSSMSNEVIATVTTATPGCKITHWARSSWTM